MYLADTIVAPATPPGRGAVAIVRLSGPRAIEIARLLWHPLDETVELAPRRLYLGEVRDPHSGVPLDRAMCVLMPGPRSLTGEDVAELHCHGGVYLTRRVVGLATGAGARLAEPGEFSRRAFLNGRIDLTEAEAIADLVDARGESALRNGIANLAGALAARVGGLREQVIAIRAHLEAEIDFSDEDIDLPSRARIAADLAQLEADVAMLHQSFARGRVIREGARAAIVGKPNAGKSSVLNLMLGAERAIVTAIPGTTRDVIEDSIQLGAWPLVLQDTAGLRDGGDQVERIGIERTRVSAGEADLLIAVFDASRPIDAEDDGVIALTAERRGVALLNKLDLPSLSNAQDLQTRGLSLKVLGFSTVTGQGLNELLDALSSEVTELAGGEFSNQVVISRQRHRDALGQALEMLAAARTSILARMPPEIVALDVAAAAEALGTITGEVSSEDILDAIFREFCIGK
ncbi:MAG TPA: tRNA uridine-5-carboxymethylaminomethyl(34) synthesis GTPase MnmE [Candidatus Binataceae bacterium]|nr:tRNA uridine-5-carboxymethylaminomethyl(34) synthesis GTPase MnmE [Candidatus Binataceae bacterium]